MSRWPTIWALILPTFHLLSSDFLNLVADGKIQITDEDFPSFLYETDTAYDEENEDIGLF